MKRIGSFVFGMTFGMLVGLIAGIIGSVGLGIISIEKHYPPKFRRPMTDYTSYKRNYCSYSDNSGYME